MSTEDTVAPQRFAALDALRGIAAFSVLFYHLRTLAALGRPAAAGSLFASGYLAVDFFFVLSGFVIAHAYGTRLREGMGLREFLVMRFVRLQPVMAIGTLIGLSLALSRSLFSPDQGPGLFAIVTGLPANLLMLPNVFVPWGIFLFNPPAWSLFYELVANAIYAARLTRTRRSSARKTAIGLLCWMVLGLAGLLLSVVIFGDLDHGVVLQDWFVALSRVSFSFSFGVVLDGTRRYWVPKVPCISTPVLLMICVLILIPDFDGRARAAYDLAFVMIFSPLLVMLGAKSIPSPANRAILDWLGAVSYPIYALHAPIKHVMEAISNFQYTLTLPLCALFVVISASIITKIDSISRNYANKFIDKNLEFHSHSKSHSLKRMQNI
ncbi:acyltransferase [Novosphingobium resinovorum]|uniref:acyltransferase family protein n=2 Tax=Sphingomonadaceae TaxID=41297 RepID=UPI0009F5A1F0|nr:MULTISPECIES: acyltransferase [Novosphingobium]MBF7014666.1 acyltransferase [Novosphingobium sp. HR1a]WJM24852.1 acyltransferase [Novosphingobium resinovorum]